MAASPLAFEHVVLPGAKAPATLTFDRARTVVVCDPYPMFALACGFSPSGEGRVAVEGIAPREALRAGVLSVVLAEEPEGAWSPRKLLEHVAIYAGLARREARRAVNHSIAAFALERDHKRTRVALTPEARKRALLATALIAGSRVVLLEDPLGGLDEGAAESVAQSTTQAFASVSWVAFVGSLPLWNPLARAADEIVFLEEGVVVERGPLATIARNTQRFTLRGSGNAEDFAEAARERGISAAATSLRVHVELPPGTPRAELFAIAEASAFAIDEIAPQRRGLV